MARIPSSSTNSTSSSASRSTARRLGEDLVDPARVDVAGDRDGDGQVGGVGRGAGRGAHWPKLGSPCHQQFPGRRLPRKGGYDAPALGRLRGPTTGARTDTAGDDRDAGPGRRARPRCPDQMPPGRRRWSLRRTSLEDPPATVTVRYGPPVGLDGRRRRQLPWRTSERNGMALIAHQNRQDDA